MDDVEVPPIQVQVQDRAVGGGSPASPSSSPLPHPTCSEGTCVSTQTLISSTPDANFITFSAKTCAELLHLLTPEQLEFEFRYSNDILGRNLDFETEAPFDSKSVQINALVQSVNLSLGHEFKEIFYGCESFAYLTHELSRSITEAQTFIDELKRPVGGDVSHDPLQEMPAPSSCEFPLPEPVRFLDFNVGEGISVDDLTDNISFRTISNRKVAHFGSASYTYGGITHAPALYPSCSALDTVMQRIRDQTGDQSFTKENWCCMATLYPDSSSHIPMHSDDEESIVPGSDIVTVSLGSIRTLTFQNILGPLAEQPSYPLEHGSIHCMSLESQFAWEHGIFPSIENCGPRLSLTFRRLQEKKERHKIPPIHRPNPTVDSHNNFETTYQQQGPKRVLMLSDSVHISFPTHLFNPKHTICIKKRLPNFCLSDIKIFENEFAYTDYVFLSCGVNDLSRYNWSAQKLFTYFKELMGEYSRKFPNTTFIFNSVLLTKFQWLNKEIDFLNFNIFNLTLENRVKLWFFDSHHVARILSRQGVEVIQRSGRRANGVHITHDVTSEIRAVITRVIDDLCCRGAASVVNVWPLREQFRSLSARAS